MGFRVLRFVEGYACSPLDNGRGVRKLEDVGGATGVNQ
jgi:hypothetical protein